MKSKSAAYLLLFIVTAPAIIFSADESDSKDQTKMISVKAFTESPDIYETALVNAIKEAKEDFEKGESRYITYGLPSPRGRAWSELLKERYGFRLSSFGCVIVDENIVFASTYNEMTRRLYLAKKEIDLEEVRQDFEKSLETKPAEQSASHNERKRSS